MLMALASHPHTTAPAAVGLHHSARPNPNPPSASTSAANLSRPLASRSLSSPPRRSKHATVVPAAPAALAPAPPAPAPVIPAILPTPIVTNPAPTAVDLASYPAADLLRLLASLLHRIATANDKIYHATNAASSSRHPAFDDTGALTPPPVLDNTPLYASLTTASRSSVASPSSPLFFHARNVPTISIESYLLRILKYCPTTNEVFLSLLVYFDRMARLGEAVQKEWDAAAVGDQHMADDDDDRTTQSPPWASPLIIDSYNVHRLIIAGITVASKFFSDVFYTNSRYAKVGGLPTQELNKLELQFLLLNDFRLAIPPEELQHYFEQLLLDTGAISGNRRSATDPTSPALELFGDASYTFKMPIPPAAVPISPVVSPSTSAASPKAQPPPPLQNGFQHPHQGYQFETYTPSSSAASSVAPTPSSVATTNFSTDGVLSSSSASTITQFTYSNNTEEQPVGPSNGTPTNSNERAGSWGADADSPAAESSAAASETGTEVGDEEDDDPTVRVGHRASVTAEDDEEEEGEGRKTPHRHPTLHSQYSSYANTDLGEEDYVQSSRREESPAASLRYVNGHWDRGSAVKEDSSYSTDDEGHVTEDEVVYRGSGVLRGRSGGSAIRAAS